MNFINTILNILFPIYCIVCGKSGYSICKKCILLSPTAERESLSWIYPIFDYRHIPIKKSIWLLKYKRKRNLAKIFGEVMYERIVEELSELSILNNFCDPLIIPIPLSKKRYRERGYNQSLLLAEHIVKLDKKNPFPSNLVLLNNILLKVKDTEHQARLKDRNRRLENLSGSFIVKNKNLINERNIILIDDVATTGATLKEAKKKLKENGAKKIIAFTIAH